tara:strand:- start:8862 stop:9320 length:459 start_codon:yes stop_codon:yes gene_type:complete
MIDPMSAFAAVSAASSAISSAIKAGRDISALSGPIAKYAKAEAQLQVGAKRKRNSFFSKLGNVEGNAIDEFFKKEEVAETRAKLREMFMLYGKPGQWERLQGEIARQRKMQMEAIEEEARIKARNQTIVIVSLIIIVALIGGYYYIQYLMTL